MTKLILVNGFDRVGKSTIIDNTVLYGISKNESYRIRHWTAPIVYEDRFQRFYKYFEKVAHTCDYVICDRSFIETDFFEKYRKQGERNITPDHKKISDLFDYCINRFTNIYPLIIKRDWELIKPWHKIEIKNKKADLRSGETLDIEKRYEEYKAYYEYMCNVFYNFYPLVQWVNNPRENYRIF